jgi:integrase
LASTGPAVVRREGKRGATWNIKFPDAAGEQVWERLGREADGWTEKRARRELGKRLAAVDAGFRKPGKLTFADFAERFRSEYLPGRNLKRSTLVAYDVDLDRHLIPAFGRQALASIDAESIDGYIGAKTAAGLSPKTISNTLTTLRMMFKVALRWRLVQANPVLLVDAPTPRRPKMNVLTEAEIARLLAAYVELEAEADEADRPWWRLARRITTLALATALRRGEILGLQWRSVKLLEGLLTVEQSYVRGEMTSPKSEAGNRTIELGPRAQAVLHEQWAESLYRADDCLVFGHPQLGTPCDPSKLSRAYMRPALKRAAIDKPFRPWHDLRHTSITLEAAAGNPQAYVQLRAGHAQGAITERYIHAAQVLFPGAAEKGETRIFAGLDGDGSVANR